MLTISKPLSAGQAQHYHQKEFTAKEQNYWSQRGVIAGEWQGRLAAELGLAGTVSAEDFAKLSQGQHPQTGEQLVRQRASYEYQDTGGKTIKTMEHRAGWDATFSAPKSVSLTALVGGDDRVREAHHDSVRTALEQLEYYTQARIGGNHQPETTGKFVAARFEHDTARPVDGYVAPQLHTHAVVLNITERENGQTRAIQPQSLFASQQFATAVYQSELTYRLRESLTFSRDKNFEREAVVDERALIRDGLRRGMGEVTYAQVRGNLETRIASGEFQTVERVHMPGRQFTTAKTIAAEQEVVSRVREGRNQVEPVLSRSQAIAVADHYPHLNRTQKNAVEDVLISPDRIQGIQGFAGSGKTTTLSVIRNTAEIQGYQVEGLAPTSRAARQLGDAGIEAGTLQAFLARSAVPTPPEQKHFYFVDESSLASTNQMREFLSRIALQDRVLLIGDTRQHQAVEAGRPFEQLQEAGMRTAKLDEIVRQKDPALKSAVEMLATGQVSAALDALQRQGHVREIPNAEERIRAIARSYIESPERTLIVSPDNASRRELNAAVRLELKANGTIAPEDHRFRILVQRQDMTGAERSWTSRYDINDVVRYARGSKSAGIEAGEYGTVVGTNSAANLLSVERSTGKLANYDPRRLTGVSVYREVTHEFSVGDRIQFTAPDKTLGVANRDLAVIESVASDGLITARLNNNRRIEFDASEHRHFDHGYAVTSHSSQGLTAERVLVNADTGVHPDLLNSRFGYVSISRASHEATLFTDDMTKLNPQLSADVSKTSALEVSQTTSISQGIATL
ncbi:MobF family relaxase [Edaphobacter aggregans]|uniref:MobF family relaxase n=1 Tax=Edaphobacter aggregans TaxID=570835 RepID=UPI0005509088|nr:MobF family relaxase [Edaphobacter aggregans]